MMSRRWERGGVLLLCAVSLGLLLVIGAKAHAQEAAEPPLPDLDLCLGAVPSFSFDAPATVVTHLSQDPVCVGLPTAAAGDVLWLDAEPFRADYEFVDADGRSFCALREYCTLTGPAPYRLVGRPLRTGVARVAIRRLNDPEGCVRLPASALSFESPGSDALFESLLDADCYLFDHADGDVARIAAEVLATNTPGAVVRQFEPATGCVVKIDEACEPSSGRRGIAVHLPLAAELPVPYRLVVDRLNDPIGCGEVASLDFGSGRHHGDAEGPAFADCWQFSVEAGDVVSVRRTAPDSSRPVTIHAEDGSRRSCHLPDECALDAGRYTAVTSSALEYHLAVRRLNDPAGCTVVERPDMAFDVVPLVRPATEPIDASCYRIEGSDRGRYDLRLQPASSPQTPGARRTHMTAMRVDAGPKPTTLCSYVGGCSFTSADIGGPFYLLVESETPYRLFVNRFDEPEGCGPPLPLEFGNLPLRASTDVPGELDCHSLTTRAGDALYFETVEPSLPVVSRVVDGSGSPVCDVRPLDGSETCEIEGDGPFHLIVSAASPGATGDHDLLVRRLNDPVGCTDIDREDVWSFTGPSVDGEFSDIDGRKACFTFVAEMGESVLLRPYLEAGTTSSAWHRVYDESGRVACSVTWVDDAKHAGRPVCTAPADGRLVLLVDGDGASGYRMNADRVTDARGCDTEVSPAFGPGTPLRLEGPTIAHCSVLRARTGDVVSVHFQSDSGRFGHRETMRVLDGSGDSVCVASEFSHASTCRLDGTGPYRLVTVPYGDPERHGGDFWFAVRRYNDPVGCEDLGSSTDSFASAAPAAEVGGVPFDAVCFLVDVVEGSTYRYDASRDDFARTGMSTPAVYSVDGDARCVHDSFTCADMRTGRHLVVVTDTVVEPTSFHLIADRVTDPIGCVDVGQVSDGMERIVGSAPAHTSDCFVFHESPGTVVRNLSDAHVRIRNGAGEVVCASVPPGLDTAFGTCALRGPGPYLAVPITPATPFWTATYPPLDYEFQLACEACTVEHPAPPDDPSIVPVTPATVLRTERGAFQQVAHVGAKPTAGQTLRFPIAGGHGIPRDARGAVLSVTASKGADPGWVVVWSCDEPLPFAASLTLDEAGRTITNTALVELASDGSACLWASTSAHFSVSVAGWTPPAGAVRHLNPSQVYASADGRRQPGGTTVSFATAGRGGIPIGADAAALSVTVTDTAGPGWVTLWSCDRPRPFAASLTVDEAGQTVTNLVLTEVDADGRVCLFTSANLRVNISSVAWLDTTDDLHLLVPGRVLATSPMERIGYAGPKPTGGQTIEVPVAGRGGVPTSGVEAVSFAVSVMQTARPGWVIVWSCDDPIPLAATLTFDEPDQLRSNLGFVELSADGTVCVWTSAPAHVSLDVNGWIDSP